MRLDFRMEKNQDILITIKISVTYVIYAKLNKVENSINFSLMNLQFKELLFVESKKYVYDSKQFVSLMRILLNSIFDYEFALMEFFDKEFKDSTYKYYDFTTIENQGILIGLKDAK